MANKLHVDESDLIPNCDIQVNMPTNITVTSTDLPHPIQFNLFDNVRVSLKLRKSHAHRHMVYMTLVDLEHFQVNNTTPMSKTEMIHAIESEEKQPLSKPRNKKKKSASMYDVLEKFRKLSIIENSSA